MFGYIVMNKPEIKFKDFDLYRSFYCGLCRELKSKYGISGQISLTYDMTFVVILLSALYEPRTQKGSTAGQKKYSDRICGRYECTSYLL